MCMHTSYLDCHEAGLCCYLVIHIEILLHPLQLLYFQLLPIYWLPLAQWRRDLMIRGCACVWRSHDANRPGKCSAVVTASRHIQMSKSTSSRKRAALRVHTCMPSGIMVADRTWNWQRTWPVCDFRPMLLRDGQSWPFIGRFIELW
jgi:hypothetical protein